MATGVSTNLNLTGMAACLNAVGIDFAFRYYCSAARHNPKRLTPNEANALSAAGLLLGAVYEDSPTSASYFSNARGHQDGVTAFGAGVLIGQPVNSAIYFAVDYDASQADITGVILPYFAGVRQGLLDAASGGATYKVGVYGSGLVCTQVAANCPFVSYRWLSESMGWRGSRTYTTWSVLQSIARADLCELKARGNPLTDEYEANQASGDFGAFSLAIPSQD
jgi:hypothetical protein